MARQRLLLEQSKIRERLNSLLGKDDLSDEERSELDTKTERAQEVEVEIRAAIVAEGEEEPEPADPGLAELEQRAKLGGIVEGLLSGHGTTGAEKELQSELKLDADQVPLSLLSVESRQVEHRTAGQTPAPTDTGASQQPIIPAVFPMAAATFLGVEMPRVPVGDATYAVLTTSVAPGTPAGGAEQAHSAAAFTASVLDPSRVQGSFFFRREDRARLAGMEEALRMNLSDAMQDKLDSEIIGSNGFLASTGGLTARTGDATAEADFAAYRGLVYDTETIDRQYASMAGSVRVLFGPHTYAHAASKYRGNSADDSALDSLIRVAGGVRVSAHIPDPAESGTNANDQDVIVAKDVGRPHAVAPVWEGVQLIVDEVTQAAEGEVIITAVMLWGGLSILRSDGYQRRKVQLAA